VLEQQVALRHQFAPARHLVARRLPRGFEEEGSTGLVVLHADEMQHLGTVAPIARKAAVEPALVQHGHQDGLERGGHLLAGRLGHGAALLRIEGAAV